MFVLSSKSRQLRVPATTFTETLFGPDPMLSAPAESITMFAISPTSSIRKPSSGAVRPARPGRGSFRHRESRYGVVGQLGIGQNAGPRADGSSIVVGEPVPVTPRKRKSRAGAGLVALASRFA